MHAGACLLALGGLCAQEQGQFWPYHDRVFLGAPLANPQAADVGADGHRGRAGRRRLEACMGPAQPERLASEMAEAQARRTATPTLFINGKRLPRLNDFAQTVDKEAARLGLPPLPASN